MLTQLDDLYDLEAIVVLFNCIGYGEMETLFNI